MGIISTILSLLGVVSLLFLITGLIKPKWVLRWSKKPTRWKVAGLWFLVFFGIFCIRDYGLPKTGKSSTEIISGAELNIKHGGSLMNVLEELKTIKSEDTLYNYAQTLIEKATVLSNIQENGLILLEIEAVIPKNINNNQFEFCFVNKINYKSNIVEMPTDWNLWFDNASVVRVTYPEKEKMTQAIVFRAVPNQDNTGETVVKIPSINEKILFEFIVDETNYLLDIGIGSKIIVQETEKGTFNLCPKETIIILQQ